LQKHTFDASETEKKRKHFNNKCIKTKSNCAPEVGEEE
jgi:hypothetical protein